jgi:hypothetical protein
MLTKSGAKLMDFGLAKPSLGTSASAGGALTPATPTLSLPSLTSPASPLTQKGHVLGTFQYMSPEQLQGCEADARSDIFAFGAVLYEMTTGRRAFEGKSQLSVITAILEKEPEPVSSLQKASPLALDHVITTCLAKNPDDRWQTAHDLKLQLQWVQAVGSQSGVSLPIVKQKRGMTALAWGLAAALAIGFALATVAYLRVSGKPTNTLVAFIPPTEKTTFEFLGDTAGPPVISPDGHLLAFVGRTEDRNQLWLRALDSEYSQALGNTEGAMFPFWSPDSRSIGFSANGKLKRIDINGGVLTSLCEAPLGRGGTWSKEGVIIFAPDFRTPLYRVSALGGEAVAITKFDSPKYNTHRWPYFLPDGKHYLYLAANHESSTDANTAIYLGSLHGKESRLIVHSLDNAAYSAGYLFFMRGDVLLAQRLDVDEGKLLSEPAAVASSVLNDINTWSAVFSVSEGMLAYQAAGHVGTQLTWLDRSGKQLGTLGDREAYDNIRISPQADRVAVVLGSPEDIWIYDVSRGVKTRLTLNPERDAVPVWSPDGSHIIFTSGKSGHAALYYKAANGTGSDELLLDSNSVDLADDWSLDGRFLLYERQTASSHADIWVLPLFGERKPFPLV